MDALPTCQDSASGSSGSHHSSDAIIRFSILKKLTVGVKDLYMAISKMPQKRRKLHLKYGDTIKNGQYVIYRELGKGSFGNVYEAMDTESDRLVAIKVIKPRRSCQSQAQNEIRHLKFLNERDNEKGFVVKMFDHFEEEGQVCIAFEMLSKSLYHVIKGTNFKGLALSQVRVFAWQILMALSLLSLPQVQIIHCDLKPENIMIKDAGKIGIKVIDFGSSCQPNQTMYKYIQSRYYRAPEVLLELPYGAPIDMWSCGCILVELYLGSPVFLGKDKIDQLASICEVLGIPPLEMMLSSPKSRFFFRCQQSGKFVLKQPRPTKTSLPNLVKPKENMATSEWRNFIDLLEKMLAFDPRKRITPYEALRHKFFKDGNSEQATFPVPDFKSKTPLLRSNSSLNNEDPHHNYRRADSTWNETFRRDAPWPKPGSMIFNPNRPLKFSNSHLSPFMNISQMSTGASGHYSSNSSFIYLSPDALEILGRPGSQMETVIKEEDHRPNSHDPFNAFGSGIFK